MRCKEMQWDAQLAELRFTEEMAAEMDLNALRELSSVGISRISHPISAYLASDLGVSRIRSWCIWHPISAYLAPDLGISRIRSRRISHPISENLPDDHVESDLGECRTWSR